MNTEDIDKVFDEKVGDAEQVKAIEELLKEDKAETKEEVKEADVVVYDVDEVKDDETVKEAAEA